MYGGIARREFPRSSWEKLDPEPKPEPEPEPETVP
eukprot:SAG31_NODE_26760_length_437_cov_0.603550_1_plen_34_part_10